MSCDISIDARIVPTDLSEGFSLHRPDEGYALMNDVPEVEWIESAPAVTSVYMHGDAPIAEPVLQAGFLPLVVEVSGDTWAEVRERRDEMEQAWRAESQFWLDVEVEGVVDRYWASRSAWRQAPRTLLDVVANRQEVTLVFKVQPFPTSPAEESS